MVVVVVKEEDKVEWLGCGVNENGGDNDDDLLVIFSDVHFQHSWNSQMMKMSW